MFRPYTLNHKCPTCKREYVPELLTLDPAQFLKGYLEWQGGALIQNAFPAAQTRQREQLQTGICSDPCWDEFTRIADKGRP